MLVKAILPLLATAHLAAAHFGLTYPSWQVDTLKNKTAGISQWNYPCAGVKQDEGGFNRTDWPLTGGSVVLDLHHDFTYIFISLGLGTNVTNFNITLTNPFLNETGNGTLCIPSVPIPASANVRDGQLATLQVVTVGESGSALYNCADVTLKSGVKLLSGDACKTSPGVSYYTVTTGNGTQQAATNGTKPSAASRQLAGSAAASSIVALALVLAASIAL